MLFIMRAASCSGKSTFVKDQFKPHTVLSSDWYRMVLTNDIDNQQQNGLVFDMIRQVLEQRLKNRLPYTVIDATNLKVKSIVEFLDLAKKYGERVTIISIDPPSIEELIERSEQRSLMEVGQKVPEDVLRRHYDSYYNSLPSFVERSKNGEFDLIRINQKYDVIEFEEAA